MARYVIDHYPAEFVRVRPERPSHRYPTHWVGALKKAMQETLPPDRQRPTTQGSLVFKDNVIPMIDKLLAEGETKPPEQQQAAAVEPEPHGYVVQDRETLEPQPIITNEAVQIEGHLGEAIDKVVNRIVDHFGQRLKERLFGMAVKVIGEALEATAKQATYATTTPQERRQVDRVIPTKPRVHIYGLHAPERAEILKEFQDKASLVISHPDDTGPLEGRTKGADYNIVMAGSISHATFDKLKKTGKKLIVIQQRGTTAVKQHLWSIIDEWKNS